jgi:hypothetical protein
MLLRRRAWLLAAPAIALAAFGAVLAGCSRKSVPSTPADADPPGSSFFQDVTDSSGVRMEYRNGEEAGQYAILETLGGGVGLIDYDGDGLLDIFFPGGGSFDGQRIRGRPCKLFKNLGGFRFRDVTEEVGLTGPWFYTHGVAVADYDRDGWPDLLVTGWGRLALLHNEPVAPKDPSKGRKFVDVTDKARLPAGLWTTSAAWGDLDGDGWPDLYVCQYVDWSFERNHPTDCSYNGMTRDVCPPQKFKGLPHRLFRNNKNGTFTDVSNEAGLRPDGRGLGVLLMDLNGDGRSDIYVANDTEDNFLYFNRSHSGKLILEEKGGLTGVSRDGSGASTGSMGVDGADFDGSGRPAVWVTNYENELHSLYLNECVAGREVFDYHSGRAGIAAIGRNHVGWGTGFLDVDHHGWQDLFVAHGHTLQLPADPGRRRQRSVLLRNEGGKFHDVGRTAGGYFHGVHNARGAALGDLDNDGRVDIVTSHLNEPAVVLRNVSASGYHWLGVELVGQEYRDVVGARVVVECGGRKQTQFAKGGGSYASSGDRRHVFGLADAEGVARVEVTWPGGRTQAWEGLAVDRYWRLVEGRKDAAPLAGRPSSD